MVLSAYLLYPAAAMATTTAMASAYIYLIRPGIAVKYMMKFLLYASGFRVKFVTADKYRYCYAERGVATPATMSLLFVHGFSANKDMWTQKLPSDFHIVVVDLPGHGDTTIPAKGEDISVIRLAQNLNEFVEAVGLDTKPFHLIGTSLGGLIAGLYAAMFTPVVGKLTLVCPAIVTPVETEFLKEMQAGKCRLIPKTTDELQIMVDSCVYKKQKIPRQFLLGFLQLRLNNNEFFERLFSELRSSFHKLDEYYDTYLKKITSPTQIIWGHDDELIHVSGAEYMKSRLPNCQRVDILDRCGHSTNMDRPGLLTKKILEFRSQTSQKL